jgi:hypothetical protein
MSIYTVGDAPDLTLLILARYFPRAEVPEALTSELRRFLWNTANFGYVVDFKDQGKDDIMMRKYKNNFIYDKRSSLVMFDFDFGYHQLMMAYLEGLYYTDISKPIEHWQYDAKYPTDYNATSQLADDYVRDGHGIFMSSTHEDHTVMVGRNFAWNPIERTVFSDYKKMVI